MPIETGDVGKQPTADAVRSWRYKYVKYADGSQELYDLFADPYELSNVANTCAVSDHQGQDAVSAADWRKPAKPAGAARAHRSCCKNRTSPWPSVEDRDEFRGGSVVYPFVRLRIG